jgi:hypothetical protein
MRGVKLVIMKFIRGIFVISEILGRRLDICRNLIHDCGGLPEITVSGCRLRVHFSSVGKAEFDYTALVQLLCTAVIPVAFTSAN